VANLRRPTVAAPVMRYDAITLAQEEQHLRVPVIGRKRPAMAEHKGLTRTPILVEDVDAVFVSDYWHALTLAMTDGTPLNYCFKKEILVFLVSVSAFGSAAGVFGTAPLGVKGGFRLDSVCELRCLINSSPASRPPSHSLSCRVFCSGTGT